MKFKWYCFVLASCFFAMQAQSVFADNGDTDAYGYTYYDSKSSKGPDYEWIDISESGTCIEDETGSDFEKCYTRGPFDIGFDFTFYGNTYDEYYVLAPGIVAFSKSTRSGCGDGGHRIPDPDGIAVGWPSNMIAGLWDTNDPSG